MFVYVFVCAPLVCLRVGVRLRLRVYVSRCVYTFTCMFSFTCSVTSPFLLTVACSFMCSFALACSFMFNFKCYDIIAYDFHRICHLQCILEHTVGSPSTYWIESLFF